MGMARDAKSLTEIIQTRLARRRVAKRLALQPSELPRDQFDVVVHFADKAPAMYQLRSWLEPLLVLNEQVSVVVVVRQGEVALQLMEDPTFPLPVFLAVQHDEIDDFIDKYHPKVALYVNHNQRNFVMLWHPNLIHVYLGHGESDKIGISASNQMKAYDYVYVAGDAAIDRAKRRLVLYDADDRMIKVGRPQTDVVIDYRPTPTNKLRTVLYAPSWEGDRISNSYGSVRTHGRAMIRSLINSGQYRVIFRPHPLSGQRATNYGESVSEISRMLTAANQTDPGANHLTDTTPALDWQLQAADACIADISAVAFDWLATGKPMVVAKPKNPQANVSPDSVVARLHQLPAAEAAAVVQWLEQAASGEDADRLRIVRDYTFEQGESMKRFVSETLRLIEQRDELLATRDAEAQNHVPPAVP